MVAPDLTAASEANLTGANLTYATIAIPKADGVVLYGINAPGSYWTDVGGAPPSTSLAGTSFVRANLLSAWFDCISTAAGSRFDGSDLRGIRIGCYSGFSLSNFTGADFSDAFLDGAEFRRVDLTGATFPLDVSNVFWNQVICPDGTNSADHSDTCVGHL